jgi:hypothetical protein
MLLRMPLSRWRARLLGHVAISDVVHVALVDRGGRMTPTGTPKVAEGVAHLKPRERGGVGTVVSPSDGGGLCRASGAVWRVFHPRRLSPVFKPNLAMLRRHDAP